MKKLVVLLMLFASMYAASDFRMGFKFYKAKAYIEAKPYLERAYKKGSPAAAFMLGRMYCNGWGVKVDYNKARKYFIDAIDRGNVRSHCCLARLDLVKRKKDKAEGLKNLKIAYQEGVPDCKDLLKYLK